MNLNLGMCAYKLNVCLTLVAHGRKFIGVELTVRVSICCCESIFCEVRHHSYCFVQRNFAVFVGINFGKFGSLRSRDSQQRNSKNSEKLFHFTLQF